VAHTLSSAPMAMPKPGPSIPPPRKPTVIGERGLPSGAIFEMPAEDAPNLAHGDGPWIWLQDEGAVQHERAATDATRRGPH
jgi:hypothetical protein